ncbi:MAG: hypothetical protein RL086_877 [Bacteroidota bacterium]
MPLKYPNERIECPDCKTEFPRSQRSWHYKFKCPMNGGTSTVRRGETQTSFQGVVRENHPSEEEDQMKFMDTIPNGTIPDEDTTTDEEIDEEEETYKKINTISNSSYIPNIQHIRQPVNIITKKFKDNNTININALNKKLTEVINNFNGHLKKLYSEKADHTDVSKLQKKINSMSIDIEAIRRTLTEQSRMVGGVQNVYRHSTKHKSKEARKVRSIIDNVIKQKAGNNAKTENVLNNLKHVIDANKNSVSKVFLFLESVKDDINTIKAKQEATDTRLNSIDNTNTILQKDVNIIKKKKHLTEEDVVRIVKKILIKEGRKVNTEEIEEIIGEDIDDVEDEQSQPISDMDLSKFSLSMRTSNKELESPKIDNQESNKEISKHFNEEMNELINKMRLTKNNDLNKTTIKSMKKIIEKHDKMGHLEEIKKYMENLPKNTTKANKKKAIVRTHLNAVIKNIEVK